jgi:hypothetical protein
LDHDIRRKKQQALMTELLERKIRLHAQHLYDLRGQADGQTLQDWVEAESQVLEDSILAPLYRRTRGESASSDGLENPAGSFPEADTSTSEASGD